MKELRDKIMSKYTPDEFSQAKGKKQADKAQSFVEGIEDIFKGPQGDLPESYSALQAFQMAQKPMSKGDFVRAVSDDPILSTQVRDIGDVAEVLDPYGTGYDAIRQFKNMRRQDAKRMMSALEKFREKYGI